jgi:preprotein translocase subunit SecF
MKFVEIVRNTKIDFIGMRKKAFILSAILVLTGIVSFFMVSFGKANLSVDFTGGTQVQIRFNDPVSIGELRNALHQKGFADAQVQEVMGTKDFFIKTQRADTDTEKIQDKVVALLAMELPGKKVQVLSSNMVGATVGKTLKRNAIIAVAISLLCIILYIAWRFNFIFGIAATIATFHDVLAMLGIFWLLRMEMNILFITALLTIAGYSLTDTVVVFDRIRENIAKTKIRSDLGGVINVSINEVLARTLNTSITTLLAIAAIVAFGGEVLFEFSFALFIGVLVGTYSSIFVASPLIYLWRKKVH